MKAYNPLIVTLKNIKASGQIALCGYFLVGYPSPKVFYEMIRVGNQLDVIEFGIPSIDPRFDGPIISDAHKVVTVQRGMDAETALALVGGLRNIPQPRFVMTYTQEGRALDGFLRMYVEHNIHGVLVPDIGPSEALYVASIARSLHLAYIGFIAGAMAKEDILQKAEISDMIYAKASKGSTGQMANIDEKLFDELSATIVLLRACKPDILIAMGIGIQHPGQVRQLAQLDIEMIIVGTKLMQCFELGEHALVEYIQDLQKTTLRKME